VAVYGTLKKGYSNYFHYLSSSKFIAHGTTNKKYPLVIKGLPYLIEKSGVGHHVEVDIFKVSSSVLANLDRLESHPDWYRRSQIDIKTKNGVLKCWVYFNVREFAENQVHHVRYTQDTRPLSYWQKADEKESESYKSIFGEYGYDIPNNIRLLDIIEDDCEDCDFDIENEKPICVNCFHDLEHDTFANYHCSGCDEWFTESEVLRFQP
jgi:gamma-glutamylaminecyclotransferase